MANERRLNKSSARTPRHGSTTTTKTTATTNHSNSSNSSGSSSNSSTSTVNGTSGGKKQSSSRQYRIPHPPVPHAQTSLLQSQRVPASAVSYSSSARQGVGQEPRQLYETRYQPAVGRGLASTTTTAVTTTRTPTPTTRRAAVDVANTTSEAAANGSADSPVPAADPDSMEAKKGLNKWGAFDSFSGSGTGTFGFGPLLFHHVDETPRDPYDTTNMMLNDPISFNPMSAISWARLDDSPESVDELLGDHANSTQQRQRGTAAGSNGSRHDASSSSYVGYVDSPASTPASPRQGGGGDGGSYGSDASESRTSSVAGSSVGNISRTFSDTSLVGRDTERSTASAQPAYASSTSSSRAPHTLQTQQQQHEQQQVYSTQPPPSNQNPDAYRATASHHPYPSRSYTYPRPQEQRHHHQQHPSSRSHPQQQQQVSMPPTTLPAHQAPPPIAPPTATAAAATTTTTDLLLCLGPHCSARFPTEAELAAHYRAEHAFTCTWTSCAAPSFTSSNALAWHVNAEHLLVCPVPGCCGAVYASKRALDGHLKGEVVTSSVSTPSGSSSSGTSRRQPQQQQQQPPQQQYHRARRRSKSPSFSPAHRPPQRARR